MRLATTLAYVALVLSLWSNSYADSFGNGANSFEIEFVTIGSPGNASDATGDPNPVGSVSYAYRIGKYEISEDMINKANALGGLGIAHDNRGPNKPATSVSWFEAAIFVNWLNTSTGGTPAYKFDGSGNFQLWTLGDAGYNPNNLYRNSLARYFLPSVNEWYKSAYYDPNSGVYFDYPTGSDTEPTAVAGGLGTDTAVYGQSVATGPADITLGGGLSPFGTMAQGGNVWEWEETDSDLVNDLMSELPGNHRGSRGACWFCFSDSMLSSFRSRQIPSVDDPNIGFRVVSVPEPNTLACVGLLFAGLFVRRFNR
jgi:formylglycine-generating enzyme required for sulfatase activity